MTLQALTNLPTPDDDRRRQEKLDEALIESATASAFSLLKEVVDAVGGYDVAAGLTGIDRSDLRRALDRSASGRYIRFEALIALGPELSRKNASLATKLGFALVRAFGLGVFPLVTLTVDEENARMKEYIRRFPDGDEALSKLLGMRR